MLRRQVWGKTILFPGDLQMNRSLALFALAAIHSGCAAQKITITTDRSSGIYSLQDSVTWTIKTEGEGLEGAKFSYWIREGGLTGGSPGLDKAEILPSQINLPPPPVPCWKLLEVQALTKDGRTIRALSGALFAPESIKPAAARPMDFDQFWNDKVKQLRQTPPRPSIEKQESGREGVDYELVTLEGWKGAKVYGQLAKPAKEGRFPAILVVQWAGVYGLERAWAVDRAADGWLTLNIQAHELPVTGAKAFFDQQSSGPLKNYPSIGADSRETSYFLRMYLSCVRAADYLASRPEWNGKVMVVTGGSQGGLQALVTAALHPKITGALASVPAGCDQSSLQAQRSPGWPMWPWFAQGPRADEIKATAPYFDVVNFAKRISCPVLVGIGGIDTVCPPPGIYAAMNQVTSQKEIVYMPLADHMGNHGAYYQRNTAWTAALKEGRIPPKA